MLSVQKFTFTMGGNVQPGQPIPSTEYVEPATLNQFVEMEDVPPPPAPLTRSYTEYAEIPPPLSEAPPLHMQLSRTETEGHGPAYEAAPTPAVLTRTPKVRINETLRERTIAFAEEHLKEGETVVMEVCSDMHFNLTIRYFIKWNSKIMEETLEGFIENLPNPCVWTYDMDDTFGVNDIYWEYAQMVERRRFE